MRAHRRASAAAALWVAAGAGWVGSAFLPWTTRGALSSSTPLDAVRLIRTGMLDGAVPAGASAALLGLPAVGVGVMGLAGLGGRAAYAARVVLVSIALALLAGSLHVLAADRPGRLDGGAWTAVAALGCAVVALVITPSRGWRRWGRKEER